MLEAVLFDLDGTLVDSEPGILTAVAAVGGWLGRPLPPRESLRRFLGPPLQDWLPEVFGLAGAQADEAVAVFRQAYGASGVYDSVVYPGIPALIEDLRSSGLRLAVATSKSLPLAEQMLTHVGLRDRFEVVHGATLDGALRFKEQVVRATLDDLRLAPEQVVLVGDRQHDVLGARRHGVPCIGAAWGYGGFEELRDAGAIAVVDHPSQVLRALAPHRGDGQVGTGADG